MIKINKAISGAHRIYFEAEVCCAGINFGATLALVVDDGIFSWCQAHFARVTRGAHQPKRQKFSAHTLANRAKQLTVAIGHIIVVAW